jgi:hypothetical protein
MTPNPDQLHDPSTQFDRDTSMDAIQNGFSMRFSERWMGLAACMVASWRRRFRPSVTASPVQVIGFLGHRWGSDAPDNAALSLALVG